LTTLQRAFVKQNQTKEVMRNSILPTVITCVLRGSPPSIVHPRIRLIARMASLSLIVLCLANGLRARAALEATMSVENIAELLSLNVNGATNKPTVMVLGYYTPGDRGGGLFQWDGASSGTPDGGRYFTNPYTSGRWVRMLNGEVANVKMWGAKGNWETWHMTAAQAHDDTTNIQNAVTACGYGLTGKLLFPAGTYKVTDTIVFPSQLNISGEGQGNNTAVVMPAGINKDIFQTAHASRTLKGGLYATEFGLFNYLNEEIAWDHWLVFENMLIAFEGTEATRNTNNACLAVCRPGEGSEIRNLHLDKGAYGIRCIGGGAPGLRARNVSVGDHAIAGINVEPLVLANGSVADAGGSINLSGISGDYRLVSYSDSASLIRFYQSAATVEIHNFKGEGVWGGGLIQYHTWDGVTGAMGSLSVYGGTYNAGPSGGQPNHPRDLIVLKGTNRTATVNLDTMSLTGVRYLIRDEVSGRNVEPNNNVYAGLAHATARLRMSYEGMDIHDPNSFGGGKWSRLIVGQTAFYSFIPPTTNAWYRILGRLSIGATHLGGRLNISSYGLETSALEVDVNPYVNSDHVFLEVTRPAAHNALVTQARAFTYWDSVLQGPVAGLDVYVEREVVLPPGLPEHEKRITFAIDVNGFEVFDSGQIQLLTPTTPVSATLPEGAVVKTVSLTDRTSTPSGQVPPAQGGLGVDASSVPADRFPYTVSAGQFDFSPVTSFMRGLLDDGNVSQAQSTLQLTPWIDVMPFSDNLQSIMVVSPAVGSLLIGDGLEWTSLPRSTSATRYLANTGTDNRPEWSQVNLANGVTGNLPVAQGGLGADNSSLAADRFPYTTGTGTFGYGTVTSFARTLLDDADAHTARSTLDVPHIVKKTDNEVITSDAVLSDDAVLKFNMATNTRYTVRLKVFFAASPTPGIKYRITGPAAPTVIRRHITRAAGGAAPTSMAIQTTYDSSDVPLTGSGVEGMIEEEITVLNGSNTGEFKFQWAQNTSDSGATLVRGGSYLQYITF
jgi:hypothetical protein